MRRNFLAGNSLELINFVVRRKIANGFSATNHTQTVVCHLKNSMKKLLFLYLLIFGLPNCLAQNDDSRITGKWKVVSVDSGDFYINVKTDSIFISKDFKEIFSDSLELDNVINVAKITYGNNTTEFGKNGVYTHKFDPKITWHGTYNIVPSDKKIRVILKDNVKWEMDYEFVNRLLHLTMTLYDKKTEFLLEKI